MVKVRETESSAVKPLIHFRPSGWDSDKKIDILTENLSMLKADEPYENVIKRPMQIRRPANRDTETSAEQEQDFLTRCHNMLSKG